MRKPWPRRPRPASSAPTIITASSSQILPRHATSSPMNSRISILVPSISWRKRCPSTPRPPRSPLPRTGSTKNASWPRSAAGRHRGRALHPSPTCGRRLPKSARRRSSRRFASAMTARARSGSAILRTRRRPGRRSANSRRFSKASSLSPTNSRSSSRVAATARWSAIRRHGTSTATAYWRARRCPRLWRSRRNGLKPPPLPGASPTVSPMSERWRVSFLRLPLGQCSTRWHRASTIAATGRSRARQPRSSKTISGRFAGCRSATPG